MVTFPLEFTTDSVYLMNHSEVQKKKVETFNTQDKELHWVLENFPKDDDSLNLQNVSNSNKATQKEQMKEGVEANNQNVVEVNL